MPVSWRLAVVLLLATTPVTAQSPLPALRATADLRIDAERAGLGDLDRMVVFPGGALALIEKQEASFRFFDAKGAETGRFGWHGEGPGEFLQIESFGTVGDTLWVSDPRLRRISYIAPSRRLLRSEPLPLAIHDAARHPGPEPDIAVYLVQMVLPDGSRVVKAPLDDDSAAPKWDEDPAMNAQTVIRVSRDLRYLGIATHIPGNDCIHEVPDPRGASAIVIPFCTRPVIGFASDGSRAAVAATSAPLPGGKAQYTLQVTSGRGEVIFSRSYGFAAQPIARATTDSARAALVGKARAPQFAEAFRTVAFPATWPPFRRLLVGRDGTIWLEQDGPWQDHRWTMLDARGTPVATLTLPPRTTLQAVQRDMAWTFVADDDDLQSLVRYQLAGGT